MTNGVGTNLKAGLASVIYCPFLHRQCRVNRPTEYTGPGNMNFAETESVYHKIDATVVPETALPLQDTLRLSSVKC